MQDTAVRDTGLIKVDDTDTSQNPPGPPLPPRCFEDGMEDNDDFDNALPVEAGPMAVLTDDPDFWRFEIEPGESRRVELSFDHSWGNIDLSVYNEFYLPVGTSYSFSDDEAVEVTNTSSVTTTARIRVLLRDPGCNTYSLAVRPSSGG